MTKPLIPDYSPFEEAFEQFLFMRKTIKKPATPYAIELLEKKLKKLAGDNTELAIDILNQSTINNYQDLYPLKSDNNSQTINLPGPTNYKPISDQ